MAKVDLGRISLENDPRVKETQYDSQSTFKGIWDS